MRAVEKRELDVPCVINRHTNAPKRHTFLSDNSTAQTSFRPTTHRGFAAVRVRAGTGLRRGLRNHGCRGRGLTGCSPAGVGAGRARRVGPPVSQPTPRPRFTSPPLDARCVAAHWLRKTEARSVFLQKFPPWAAAELVTSVGAVPAAVTVTIRDGGGCCGTCCSPEVRVFPSLLLFVFFSVFL